MYFFYRMFKLKEFVFLSFFGSDFDSEVDKKVIISVLGYFCDNLVVLFYLVLKDSKRYIRIFK